MNRNYLFAVVILLFVQKAYSQVARFSIEGGPCINNELTFHDETTIQVSAWAWNFGDGTSSILREPTHAYTDTGLFNIELIVSSNGNSFQHSEKLYISANPTANFMVDSQSVHYSSYSRVFIDASKSTNPISHFEWNYGDNTEVRLTDTTSIYYKYSNSGNYSVQLKSIDNRGCADSITKTIQINDRFYVPNVFTPNNDQINDNFVVTSNGITLFSIEIYSRWGNLLFKREGHEQIVWDGHLPDGSLVKPGTYYYVINSETGDKTYDPEKGFITVFY